MTSEMIEDKFAHKMELSSKQKVDWKQNNEMKFISRFENVQLMTPNGKNENSSK